MKWYFASRTKHQQKLAILSRDLEKGGESITSTWVYITEELLPYHEHIEAAQRIAAMDIEGVLASEVFVLISDPAGTDMFAELGAALAKHTSSPESIHLYIVGEHAKRSLIQLHPAITHLPTIKEVFEKEGIDCTSFEIPELG